MMTTLDPVAFNVTLTERSEDDRMVFFFFFNSYLIFQKKNFFFFSTVIRKDVQISSKEGNDERWDFKLVSSCLVELLF